MQKKTQATVLAVFSALATFALSRVVWPDPPSVGIVPPGLLALFIFLGIVTSVAFGIGAVTLIYGAPWFRRLRASRELQTAAWLSVSWLLLSWWPHENMHRVNHESDLLGLLKIEYLFHVTSVAAAAIIALTIARNAENETVPAAQRK